ncbi:MAG TPA: hypothetical protein VFS35_10610 [Terrimicrobiaceae bacterium]|nr:hypothetical protein [Terrimicrobiaceae bacterium]
MNELDREEARRQIINPIADRDEIVDTMADDDRPDAGVAPGSSGSRTEKIAPDDESLISENLVREGVEEAEFRDCVAPRRRRLVWPWVSVC